MSHWWRDQVVRQAPPNRRDQAGYHPCWNVTNLKHAHNLTQTEVDFVIEVMLNFLEKISTTSVFPLNQLHSTYSKKVHTSFIIVVKQLMANAVKDLFAGNLIVVFTRVVWYSIQIFFATTGLHVKNMQKDTTRPKPG